MGSLQHSITQDIDLLYEIASIRDSSSESPLDNPSVTPKPTFVNREDVSALKQNILSAHALGILPTRKLFEQIASQGQVTPMQKAARYAQEFIDSFAQSLSPDELERFDYRSVYREKIAEYMALQEVLKNSTCLFEISLFEQKQDNRQEYIDYALSQ